jgi:hypothetical protein
VKGKTALVIALVAALVVIVVLITVLATRRSGDQQAVDEARAAQQKAEDDLAASQQKVADLKKQLRQYKTATPTPTPTPTATTTGVYTPPKGGTEWNAIVVAVQSKIHWTSKDLTVKKLKVQDGWAYGVYQQVDPADPATVYESFSAVCRNSDTGWKCLWAVGGADAADIEDQTGMTIPQYLQAKYPQAPAAIFK